MTRHFLEVDDLDADELDEVLAAAEQVDPAPVMAGKGAALIFEKPSLRTRNSMELAVVQLGGHPVTIFRDEAGIDTSGYPGLPGVARTRGCTAQVRRRSRAVCCERLGAGRPVDLG